MRGQKAARDRGDQPDGETDATQRTVAARRVTTRLELGSVSLGFNGTHAMAIRASSAAIDLMSHRRSPGPRRPM